MEVTSAILNHFALAFRHPRTDLFDAGAYG